MPALRAHGTGHVDPGRFSPAAVSPGARSAAPRPGQTTRVAEEQSCLRTILLCLGDVYLAHSDAAVAPPSAGSAPSLDETAEFLDLVVSLVTADASPHRLKVLLFGTEPGCIELLAAGLRERPVSSSLLGSAGHARLRVMTAQALTKLLSLCTDDETVVDADIAGDDATVASLCRLSLEGAGFIPVALAALVPLPERSGGPSEGQRVALAECLFVAVMRVPGVAQRLAACGGGGALAEAVFRDGSAMVRNYAAATLRVLAEHAPAKCLERSVVQRSLEHVRGERSRYVVILLLELVALLLGAFPDLYLLRCSPEGGGMADDVWDATRGLLTADAAADIATAVLRLLETVFVLEACSGGRCGALITTVLVEDAWKPLLSRDAQQPVGIKVLNVRAMRRLVQCCTTPALCGELHDAFTRFFPSLSLLLNADPAAAAGAAGGGPEAQQLRVELALCFAVLLAKHPQSREFASDTLRAYPVWMAQIRERLLAALADATPRLLNSVFVIDAAACWLNDHRQYPELDWGDRGALAVAAAHVFAEQELSVAGRRGEPPPTFAMEEEAAEDWSGLLPPQERKARLTHALLSHAVRVTLTPKGSHEDVAREPPQLPLSWMTPVEADAALHGADGAVAAAVLEGLAANRRTQVASPARRARPPGAQRGRASCTSRSPAARRRPETPGAPTTRARSAGTRRAPAPPADDVVDMAILTYLPVTHGAYYDRHNRTVTRHFPAPSGPRTKGGTRPFLQQVTKAAALQSWEASDLQRSDLFGFFIPFSELTVERVERELQRLHRHSLKMKKGSLTTPASQRGRRWFYCDMHHHVLPKAEKMLTELRDLVAAHGQQNILFFLNIVKLMEQQGGQQADLRGQLQAEVQTVSGSRYPDTLHCGNLRSVLDRMADYFSENQASGAAGVPGIEEDIRRLEDAAARDVGGSGSEADSPARRAAAPAPEAPWGQAAVPGWDTDSDEADRPTQAQLLAAAAGYNAR
eukprot:TRINITY_DN9950_c0_g1_i2.p2 TRINITY_DN9950_c0_g1~~TRINITY_DN9950_c0_g1_i2.p2  ORF type:complete len:983 (+),score=308.29 TRINITY_DN9950_c0_g1_i2:78-3026(+)